MNISTGQVAVLAYLPIIYWMFKSHYVELYNTKEMSTFIIIICLLAFESIFTLLFLPDVINKLDTRYKYKLGWTIPTIFILFDLYVLFYTNGEFPLKHH